MSTARDGVTRHAWLVAALLGTVLLAAGQFVATRPMALAVQVAGTAAVAVCVGRRPARSRNGWYVLLAARLVPVTLLAVSFTAPVSAWHWAVGTAVEMGLFVVGLVAYLVERDGDSRIEGVVDAGIVGVGLVLVGWTFLVEPSLAGHPPGGNPDFGLAICFTAMDLVVLACLIRAGVTVRRLTGTGRLLAAAAVTVFGADMAFVTRIASIGTREFPPGGGVFLAWQLSGVLVTAAALHPSLTRPARRPDPRRAALNPLRLGVFVLLALASPFAVLAGVLRTGQLRTVEVGPLLVGPALLCALLCVLLVVRAAVGARVVARQAAAMDRHAEALRVQAIALRRALAEQAALQGEMAHRALHDPLTGLANRTLLRDRLAAVLGAIGPHRGALLLIDLDGFKDVNDTLGHPVGDLLLVEVARRLSDVHGPADTLARLGGDEFALLLTSGPIAARGAADRALEALRPPFGAPGGHQIYVTGSLGLLDLAGGVEDPAVALQEADLALYAAKAAGKNQVVEFHPRLRESRVRRSTLVTELRAALRASRLAVHYQPIVELATGVTVAVEALLRWPTPTGTFVAPSEFIPLAEESGLVIELGTQVLRDACGAARHWAVDHGVALSVNVSGRQLTGSGFADVVLLTLAETDLRPDALILEITESVLVGGGDARSAATVGRNLRRLRHHGVRIAVDDFGTGYSSLAALHQLPIDILKIDKSFVAPLDGHAGPRATFAEAILRLSQSLGLTTIAEGVETTAQAATLRALGCPLAQGYLLGRPVPADRVTHDLTVATVPS